MNNLRQAIISSAIGNPTKDQDSVVARRYCFKPDFIGFRGHFPGYPILPAFIQILTAITLVESHKNCLLDLASVEKAKFHLPLHPNLEIEVICTQRQIGDKSICDARLTVAEGLASSFRFTFSEMRDTPC
jgi:3-hydroxyacyl-[acyl-carrier-protein] dehydratase